MATEQQRERLRKFAHDEPQEFLELVMALDDTVLDTLYAGAVPLYQQAQGEIEAGYLEQLYNGPYSPLIDLLLTKFTPQELKAFHDQYIPSAEEP